MRVHPPVVLGSDVVLLLLLLPGLLPLQPQDLEVPVFPEEAAQTLGLPAPEVRLQSDHLGKKESLKRLINTYFSDALLSHVVSCSVDTEQQFPAVNKKCLLKVL